MEIFLLILLTKINVNWNAIYKEIHFFLLETLATNSCAIDNLIKNKFTQINNCNIVQMRHLQSKSRWRHKFQYLFSSWGCMLYQIVFCKKKVPYHRMNFMRMCACFPPLIHYEIFAILHHFINIIIKISTLIQDKQC